MSLDNLSSAQKDELMTSVKQQIALANAQELLTVGLPWSIDETLW